MTYWGCTPGDQIPVIHVGSERRLSSDTHIQNRSNAAKMLRHLIRGYHLRRGMGAHATVIGVSF